GAQLSSAGTPLNLVRFLRSYAVQEQPLNTEALVWPTIYLPGQDASPPPQVIMRFTDFAGSSPNDYHVQSGSIGTFTFTDCQFHSGSFLIETKGSATAATSLTMN